ncbi:hypothetical protein ACH0B6_08555 [Solibacillus silvestris]
MKKLVFSAALVLSLGLAACGDAETKGDKNLGNENSEDVKEEEKKLAENADEVIEYFKAEGLEIGEISDLENKEFGNLREEGKRILVPSLGEDAGGRLFKFKDSKGLEEAKSYYDEISNSGPMFYSHVHVNGLYLLQMNGDMSDEDFARYAATLDNAVTGKTDITVTAASANESAKASSLTEAEVGEVFEDSFAGTYTIEKTYKAPTDKYKSADVEFSIDQIKTAKLVASDPGLIETAAETNVLILSITGENLSDDTVSFHPNTATMTTNTKRQIDSNVMISPFESEFIGNVIQKGEVIFDLGEEGLNGATGLTFVFDGPAKDSMTIGEDVKVDVSLN